MGHDHQQSSSSGAVVAIVVAVLLVGIIGLLAVAGVGLLLVGTSRMESQPATIDIQLADQDEAMAQSLHSSDMGTERLNFEVTIDGEGNASIDGNGIGLDELRAQLAKLKDEISGAFSVQINADPECLFKHVVSVMDVCEEVGGIDYRVASSRASESADESNAEGRSET